MDPRREGSVAIAAACRRGRRTRTRTIPSDLVAIGLGGSGLATQLIAPLFQLALEEAEFFLDAAQGFGLVGVQGLAAGGEGGGGAAGGAAAEQVGLRC